VKGRWQEAWRRHGHGKEVKESDKRCPRCARAVVRSRCSCWEFCSSLSQRAWESIHPNQKKDEHWRQDMGSDSRWDKASSRHRSKSARQASQQPQHSSQRTRWTRIGYPIDWLTGWFINRHNITGPDQSRPHRS